MSAGVKRGDLGRRRPPETGPVNGPLDLLIAARPRQWVKNLLVFAAPAAAGVVFHSGPLLRCVAAFAVFTAASASTYLVNDVVDRDADRLHPKKRFRPVAAGRVTPLAAVSLSSVLLAASLAGAFLVSSRLAAIVAAYVGITFAYTAVLKHIAVIELACVASGFILRAVAGGAAVGVPLSPWFLLVASFGALFIVAGKRTAEHELMGAERATHRASLGEYPAAFLRSVRVLSASVTVAAYCLWAFERSGRVGAHPRVQHLIWFELSIIPFVLALLAVELAFERGRGGEPEELALKDRTLQALGVTWVVLLLLGIYL